MRSRWLGAAVLAFGLTLVAGPGTASAAKVVNGGFERGNLSGWQRDYFPVGKGKPPGQWYAYDEAFPRLLLATSLPAPPRGRWGAVTYQNGRSVQILSQVVKLKAHRKHRLKFLLAYDNANDGDEMRLRGDGAGPGFFTPASLGLGQPNQQFRMDVMKPGADIRAVNDEAVLKRVYRTEVGDPNHRRRYRSVTANLTRFAGQKVRLRFAVAVTESPLSAGIDAVKVKTKRSG